jgi:beta-lactamase class A
MTGILRALLLASLVFAVGAHAAPKGAATNVYPDLRDSYDRALQKGLERSLERLGLREAVRARHLAVSVVDISDLKRPRVAAVNGDHMLYAASLPKIAILLGAFVEIERGRMKLDAETRETLIQMIRVSSNEAATAMLRRVGKQNLESILMSDRFRLYDPAHNGGLWVGKEYGDSPAYHRDPLHNLSHGATALQVARFYYMLETGQLIKPELARQMKEILGNPGIHHKFVKGLEDTDSRIFRKSGTWEQWHADSAIVERDGRRYIIVGLAEDRNGGQWLSELVKPVDAMIIPTRMAAADMALGETRRTATDATAALAPVTRVTPPPAVQTLAALDTAPHLKLKRSEMRLLMACARDTRSSSKAVVLCR